MSQGIPLKRLNIKSIACRVKRLSYLVEEVEVGVEEEVLREKPEEPEAFSKTCAINCWVSLEDRVWRVILMEVRWYAGRKNRKRVFSIFPGDEVERSSDQDK
jgi:hypothetical protein